MVRDGNYVSFRYSLEEEAMNNDDEGETAKANRESRNYRPRVSFQVGEKEDDAKKNTLDTTTNVKGNGGAGRGGIKQSLGLAAYSSRDSTRLNHVCQTRTPHQTHKQNDLLSNSCESFSSLSIETRPPKSRFQRSHLLRAFERSKRARTYVEKIKKHTLRRRLEHDPKVFPAESMSRSLSPLSLTSSSSSSRESIEKRPDDLTHQRRRVLSAENARAMMTQSLPLTMMPFVENALKTAHFFRRRRNETGHGRIVHRILVDQHMRIQEVHGGKYNKIQKEDSESYKEKPGPG